ncbi:MAG: hypothetical protein JNL80_16870, partial [Phycisphaerae bacterium]|nr:hypothetical protein [Phycisphaerae bacterium]
MRSRFAAIARALLVLASSACIASTALAGIEAKDRLLAASAIVEEARLAPTIDGRPPAVEPSREHLWVVLPLPPKSPNDTTNRGRPAIGFGTGASNAVSVLLHAPAEAPGIINVVAEHASMPEAITAFGDAVYLVFRAPTFNRREVLVRRAEWNEATQRSFAVPPQGELLPSLPLDGDLIGLVADSRGLWALLVSSPAARYGVRRDGASESEPRLPSLMRLERSGWKLVPFPSWAASTRAASSANPSASDRARQVEPHVEPLTLVDGPRGARVLFRQGADLFLVDPLEESVADPSRRRVAVLPRVRHPLDGFDGRSAWFQTVNPLASQENPFAMTFGVVDWQLLNTPQGRDGSAIPLGVTTPSFNRPGSARSPLQIHWLPISEASLADGAEVTPAVATTDEVVIKGQAAGPTPKPWAVVRAADGLLLVTVTSP